MATSEFSSTENTCEGDNCEAITDVTYYVKEKKRLCKNCASKQRCIMEARKGLSSLYCKKHPDKGVEVYCKKHDIAVCCICGMTDHKPCVLQDIADAVEEIKANLNGLKGKAKDKLKSCRDYRDQILQCRKDSDAHLQAVKDEVDLTIQEAIKTDQDREEKEAAKINQEIDAKNETLQEKIEKLQEEIRRMNDEIRENNEKRKKRHELNHTNAEKRREPMNDKQRILKKDIENIVKEIEKKIGELEKSWRDIMKTTEDTIQALDTVLEDDINVIKDGNRVNTSVADELKKPLDEGGVTHITQTIRGVRFVKGVGRKYNGRIDEYDGEWKPFDTINVKNNTCITFPSIVGCIDDTNVIITDWAVGAHPTYMLDMNTKHTQKVITGSEISWVTSCALLDDDKIVCGKARKGCTGDSLTGCIIVYDRQWKLIRDFTIPRNTTYDYTWGDVAADQDGMIIASEVGQSKLYVINPADGKIINTITYKQNIMMFDVLSSGHIIARPSPRPDHRVFIIDREGNHSREIPHSDVIWNVCIDPMTDDLYVVTSHDDNKMCVIDQVMSGGDMMKRRVVSFPLSTRLSNTSRRDHLKVSRVMMTSSGKMIVSDGDNILVFKKVLTL